MKCNHVIINAWSAPDGQHACLHKITWWHHCCTNMSVCSQWSTDTVTHVLCTQIIIVTYRLRRLYDAALV